MAPGSRDAIFWLARLPAGRSPLRARRRGAGKRRKPINASRSCQLGAQTPHKATAEGSHRGQPGGRRGACREAPGGNRAEGAGPGGPRGAALPGGRCPELPAGLPGGGRGLSRRRRRPGPGLTSRPVQLEDVPQVLGRVLDVDAVGGGHGARTDAATAALPRPAPPPLPPPVLAARAPVGKRGPAAAFRAGPQRLSPGPGSVLSLPRPHLPSGISPLRDISPQPHGQSHPGPSPRFQQAPCPLQVNLLEGSFQHNFPYAVAKDNAAGFETAPRQHRGVKTCHRPKKGLTLTSALQKGSSKGNSRAA